MSEEELENLKEKAENGDESAIEELVDYYDSIGDTNEAELWKELLTNFSKESKKNANNDEKEIIYDGEDQKLMDWETLYTECHKYHTDVYEQYSFMKLDELIETNPYANFEYGKRYIEENNFEGLIYYFKKGVELLEKYNSNNQIIQLDLQMGWLTIARASYALFEKNESYDNYAAEAYNAYQNVIEMSSKDVYKIEAYLYLSLFLGKGVGVTQDIKKSKQYEEKGASLYVEGCLIQTTLSNDNIQIQKWLEKAQTVTILGYDKYAEDEYFRDVLNVKLWINEKNKIDGQKVEVTLAMISNIYSNEGKSEHHKMAKYFTPSEKQILKQKTNDFLSELLKTDCENIEEKDTLYKLIVNDSCDYTSNDSIAYQIREFLKRYICENYSESWVTDSHIQNLYRLLVERNQGAVEWGRTLSEQSPEIKTIIDAELQREESEKQKIQEEVQQKKLELELAEKECKNIEEKIVKSNSKKIANHEDDFNLIECLKKPILVFFGIMVLINVFGMGYLSKIVIFGFIIYVVYAILYVEQPEFVVKAIKESSLGVDIREWKTKKEISTPDFVIQVSNDFVINNNQKMKVYFGKFENVSFFSNDSNKHIIKPDGTIEQYQNIKIEGYQTIFKGIIIFDALYINLDMNKVIDGDISLDSASLEIHNFGIEKE